MVDIPLLTMPNFQLPFEIETNASGMAVDAILMQSRKPLAFFSQALSERARRKSVYEWELMAIVFAVQKWRQHLMGHPVIIKIDQRSLKYLLEQRVLVGEQQKWVSKLLGYDFEVQYKLGKDNRVADELSIVEF